MTSTQILSVIGSISSILFLPIVLWSIIRWINNIVSRHILNNDIACSVLNYDKNQAPIFTAKIKIAYAGNSDNILEDISFVYYLRLPAPWDRFLAYLNVATGYLTCDMAGLAAILGTQHYNFEPPMIHLWEMPRYIKYPISVLCGIFAFYYVCLMILFIPIGWLFLNMGPYGKFRLVSVKDKTKITDADGAIVELPMLLKASSENIYHVEYEMGLDAKGFLIETPYQLLASYPPRTVRPPKPGSFVWKGKGHILVRLRSKWSRLKVEYDNNAIIGIGN
jgi:hypothetical protein